eukprot:TRINITY_DN12614_c0_g1_i1.p1 TRINITY_DN12614_c0_g1~~TRINITY_DN12614_c0_g1_i1.p1  ORF type:complete len:260 (-),score=73.39 TRINITY_DN12614_c0_g1_i1:23-802(-)
MTTYYQQETIYDYCPYEEIIDIVDNTQMILELVSYQEEPNPYYKDRQSMLVYQLNSSNINPNNPRFIELGYSLLQLIIAIRAKIESYQQKTKTMPILIQPNRSAPPIPQKNTFQITNLPPLPPKNQQDPPMGNSTTNTPSNENNNFNSTPSNPSIQYPNQSNINTSQSIFPPILPLRNNNQEISNNNNYISQNNNLQPNSHNNNINAYQPPLPSKNTQDQNSNLPSPRGQTNTSNPPLPSRNNNQETINVNFNSITLFI